MRSKTCMIPTAAILAAVVGSPFSLAQPPAPGLPKQTIPPAPPAAVDLRPKFQSGRQTRYSFDQTAKSTFKPRDSNDPALDQEQLQTEHIVLVLKVVESGDAGSTIQVVYESIKIRLVTPDGPAEYDSSKPPAKKPAPGADPLKEISDLDASGTLALIVGPMVGATIAVKTDRSGAITSVRGGDALGGSMTGLDGMGGSLVPSPSAVANWLVAGLGGPGNNGFARIGETWTNSDSLSGTPVGAFGMTTRHTLRSVSGGTANVSFVGAVEPASHASPPGGALAQVLSASYTGEYAWDTRAGALAEMSADMRVTMEGGIPGAKGRMTSQTQVKVRRQ